jgi:hypothetical protein
MLQKTVKIDRGALSRCNGKKFSLKRDLTFEGVISDISYDDANNRLTLKSPRIEEKRDDGMTTIITEPKPTKKNDKPDDYTIVINPTTVKQTANTIVISDDLNEELTLYLEEVATTKAA